MDLQVIFSEAGYMAKPPLTRLAEIRKQQGLTQQELADAVGAHWITISKLERGKMQLTFNWLEKLSAALSVFPADLISESNKSLEIKLKGEVVETHVEMLDDDAISAKTYLYDTDDNESFWVRISDDSCRPRYRKNDLIKFVRIDLRDVQDHIGRLAITFDEISADVFLSIVSIGANGLPEYHRINAPIPQGHSPSLIWIACEIRFYLVSGLDTP